MTSCPCCGSQVDRPVIVSLETNVVATPMGSVHVQPKTAATVAVLLRKYPKVVRFDELGVGVWGLEYFELAQDPIRVQIRKTRKAIAPIGLEIKNCWSVGYRLSPSKTEGA